jgi:predicted MFS family arabinose efflux permease
MAAAVPFSFAVWRVLLNNFAIDTVAFNGADMGMLQSLREVPGFLAFTFVLWLSVVREQHFALISLAMLGLGTALTGFFPSVLGVCMTTVIMSVGFHYYETAQGSLALQWLDKRDTPRILGRMIAVGSASSLASYALVYLFHGVLDFGYAAIYLLGGGTTLLVALVAFTAFPTMPTKTPQRKHLILRKRYWLYYTLTFMGGARRQIFTVFAAFMMVEKFGYDVESISLLYIVNAVINMLFASRIGALVGRVGERRALTFEYTGLILVFVSYAFVDSAWFAAILYVIDHALFAMAIAIKTYFQKIADPRDLASTAGVAFTINHIAAVVIPAAFGMLWMVAPHAVFLAGAGMSLISLLFARFVPGDPMPGFETTLAGREPRQTRLSATRKRTEGLV